jgi:hypothetical protein
MVFSDIVTHHCVTIVCFSCCPVVPKLSLGFPAAEQLVFHVRCSD